MSHSDTIFETAKKVFNHSYSPYSKFKVSAAVLTENGTIYGGVNVENSSYGATVCAERVAILKAISEGNKKIKEIVVLTDNDKPWPPCGMCLQVLSEFASNDTKIFVGNLNGIQNTYTFNQLVTEAFTPDYLKK